MFNFNHFIMDFDVLKAFLELFRYPICDVVIGNGYLSFSVITASFDLRAVESFNVLRLSFPDRKDFVYYPDMQINSEKGSRVIRIYYSIEKVSEYLQLRRLEYK